MSISFRSIIALAAVVFLFAIALTDATPLYAAGKRDILWGIATNCLDPTIVDYCKNCPWPRNDVACSKELACEKTSELWAESTNYVVIRDSKMCGCPDGFVHGLAIPRAKVTGVEDKNHPNGIWKFAWGEAEKRIPDKESIALVVNPSKQRGQDQLHVHLLRLSSDARQRFVKLNPNHVQSFDDVWRVAIARAASDGLADYGVLVATNPQGGYWVVIDKDSPEKKYTEFRCR